MTTKREFRTVGAAMRAEARKTVGAAMTAEAWKTGRASLRGIVGGAMTAAALVLGMTACSSENDLAGETKTVEEPTAQTATVIHVTVGAGITDPTPDPSPTREGRAAGAPAAGSSADDGAAAPLPSRGGAGVGSVTHSAGSGATTRSTVDYTGGTRTLQFTSGDRLWVRCEIGDAEGKILAGFLDIDAGSIASTTTGAGTPEEKTTEATSASFSGELKVYGRTPSSSEYGFDYTESSYDFGGAADVLAYCLSDLGEAKGAGSATATLVHSGTQAAFDNDGMHGDGKYALSTAADANALMASRLAVSGDYDAASQAFLLTAEAGQPILNCTIAGLKAGATYTMTYSASIDDGTYREHTTGSVATDASGTATFACFGGTRLYDGSQWVNNLYHRISLTNTADEGDTYTVSLGQKAFEGKVYNVSRYWDGTAMHPLVDLSKKTGNYYTAQDGEALTGTMPSGKYVKIADGATVTLCGVTIEGKTYGIVCKGNNTIILADGTTNTVKGGSYYPGVSPPTSSAKTLTIQGNGTLIAEGGSDGGPGIGGAHNFQAGNITIEGGNITATGGESAAGIGAGAGTRLNPSYCGDITISGGTVEATGGDNAAGIGSGKGYDSSHKSICGTVTITTDVTLVTATKGDFAVYSIGKGYVQYSSCGTVTIDGVADATTSSTFTHLTSAVDGNTWTLTKAN